MRWIKINDKLGNKRAKGIQERMQWIVLIVYACMSVGGLTCFKLGSQQAMSIELTRAAFAMQMSWLSLIGLGMYVCSFLIYLGLVSRMQLGYLMPVTSAIVYIFTMVASLLIFKEEYSLTQIAGILLILFGVVLMNVKK